MNKEEWFDKYISQANQDIQYCEEHHCLKEFVASLLENNDYWKNEYNYMKKCRDNLRLYNKLLCISLCIAITSMLFNIIRILITW